MIGEPESRLKRRDRNRRIAREREARRWEIIAGIFIALCVAAVTGWRAIRECRRHQQLDHFCSTSDLWAWLVSAADPMFWIHAGVMLAIAGAVIVLAIRGKLS